VGVSTSGPNGSVEGRGRLIELTSAGKKARSKSLTEVFGWMWLLPPQAVALLPTPTDDRLPCVRRFGVVLPKLTLARRDHISASVGLRNHLSGGYIVHFAPKSANSVTRCPFRRARSVGFTSWLRGAAGVESQSAHDERPDGR
jgi:hypothetical protein